MCESMCNFCAIRCTQPMRFCMYMCGVCMAEWRNGGHRCVSLCEMMYVAAMAWSYNIR